MIFRNIHVCTYTYVHVVTVKKENMNLRESGGVHGRVWRKERKGGTVIIITIKFK